LLQEIKSLFFPAFLPLLSSAANLRYIMEKGVDVLASESGSKDDSPSAERSETYCRGGPFRQTRSNQSHDRQSVATDRVSYFPGQSHAGWSGSRGATVRFCSGD